MARRPDLLVSKLPNKGKVESALRGEKNLIAMAYKCRTLPNMLQEQLVRLQLEEETDTIENNEELFTLLDVPMTLNQGSLLLENNTPSILLRDNGWIDEVFTCFEIKEVRNNQDRISKEIIRKAEVLHKKLLERLTGHLKRWVKDPNKRKH